MIDIGKIKELLIVAKSKCETSLVSAARRNTIPVSETPEPYIDEALAEMEKISNGVVDQLDFALKTCKERGDIIDSQAEQIRTLAAEISL